MYLLVAALIVVAILLFYPQFRTLFHGFMNLIAYDAAKTPKGAKAVYAAAIDEAQENYNKSSNALEKLSGQLQIAQDNLKECNAKIAKSEAQISQLIKADRRSDAEIYAEQRQAYIDERDGYQKDIETLTPMVAETKELCLTHEKRLVKLKADAKIVVANLERNIQQAEMYKMMDDLRRDSGNAKMLGAVKDGSQEAKEQAVGARIVHENKLSTKVAKADQVASAAEAKSYVDQIAKTLGK